MSGEGWTEKKEKQIDKIRFYAMETPVHTGGIESEVFTIPCVLCRVYVTVPGMCLCVL